MTKRSQFAAHHSSLLRCDCGCGTLKLCAHDEHDNIKATISHDPEQWLAICREIARECLAMLGEEGGDAVRH
jgi:hypothetical protein